MKRRAFLQEHLGRLALTFLLLCLIVYTLFHALGASDSLLTAPAREISDTSLLSGTAWIFRDETLLTVPEAGLVHPLAESGSKVGKNTSLAEVYPLSNGADRAAAQAELDLLNQTLALLEASLPEAGETVAKAEAWRAGAVKDLLAIRRAVREGDWSAVSELEDGLLVQLNRYGALTGGEEALRAAAERARADRDAALQGTPVILSNESSSAYYYGLSEVDGYESLFTEAALESLTAESFAALKESRPVGPEEGFAAGKLCYGYSWHAVVEFADGGELFEPGVSYRIAFPESNGAELVLLCERQVTGGEGDLVIFRSDVTPLSFRYLRSQSVRITVGATEGLYVPEPAYREEHGMAGVFVLEDSTVRFRRIEVIYRGNGYVIAALRDPDPDNEIGYLRLNDLMITSGKKLYDGKVYQ